MRAHASATANAAGIICPRNARRKKKATYKSRLIIEVYMLNCHLRDREKEGKEAEEEDEETGRERERTKARAQLKCIV